MKVLIISSSVESLLNFRLDLIKAVQAKNYVVHVACPGFRGSEGSQNILTEQGVIVHPIPMSRTGVNPVFDLMTLIALYRLMIKVKPSVVLSYTIKPVVWGGLAARLANIPRVYALITGLGYAFVDGVSVGGKRKFIRSVVELLYSISLSKCSRVFFQNPDDEALFRKLKLLAMEVPSTVVNGSGVNLSHFQLAPLPKKLAFIFIARLLVDKGIRQFAEAASLLKLRYPDVEFKVVGYLDDNPESIEQSELDAWVASEKLVYLGRLSDVRPAIAGASVFVLPTFYREGVPRTILEALAMGRAIVTTDTPGCRETVVHGVNGYLVKPEAVEELVSALEKLILNPQLVVDMGNASYRIACDKFDVHKVNQKMLLGMEILQ